MIKDVFVLSKNAWHAKLMYFIWKYDYRDFPSMCPYFWLSVLNVIIVIFLGIPYGIYRILKPFCRFIGDMCSSLSNIVDEYCENRAQKWMDAFIDRLREGDEGAWKKYNSDANVREKIDYSTPEGKLLYNAKHGYSTKTLIEDNEELKALRIQFDKYMEEERIRQNLIRQKEHEKELARAKARENKRVQDNYDRGIQRRKRIGRITVKIQKAFKFLGYLLACAGIALAVYLVYLLGVWLSKVNWVSVGTTVLEFLKLIGFLGLGLGVLFVIGKGGHYLMCRYGRYCIPCKSRQRKIKRFFGFLGYLKYLLYIFKPVLWFFTMQAPFWRAIGQGLSGSIDIIRMLYKNHCPPIDWKD
jgi:hypothetical protein